jgi:5-methylcytosine-specific restriction endonuclease McrA
MPSGVYVRTKEHNRKNSEVRKGEKHQFWGKPLSDEHKKNISEAQKGKPRPYVSERNKATIGETRPIPHGEVYGYLTVIEVSHRDEKSRYYYKCQCSCGSAVIVRKDQILSGHTKSCGCLHPKRYLTGRLFTRLTVTALSHRDKWGATHWVCKCSCGNIRVINGTSLLNGHAKSCGCLQKETVSKPRESNPNWQGGKSFEEYSEEWTQELKQGIRERDNYACQLCGKLQEDKEAHVVHHIDVNKKHNKDENLVTLCRNCHGKVHGKKKKEYWKLYFTELLKTGIETRVYACK